DTSSNTDCAGTNLVYWRVNSRDALMHALAETAGNSVPTTRSYEPTTGRLKTIRAGVSSDVAKFDYSFDSAGNLTSRSDTTKPNNVVETFTYDPLNRVLTGAIGGGSTMTMSYDRLGNIKTKAETASPNGGDHSWTYSYADPNHLHAVSAIATG